MKRKVRISFKYVVQDVNEKNKIIEDLMWHGVRVYNTLLHELREVRRKIDKEKSINMIQIAIYKEYREDNWHSEYLHSHTL